MFRTGSASRAQASPVPRTQYARGPAVRWYVRRRMEDAIQCGGALPVALPVADRAQRWRAHTGLFGWALALRVLTAFAISRVSGVSLRNLALFYDGHLYLLVSKTWPKLYSDPRAFFPAFPETPDFLTVWFPAYPAAIRLWTGVAGGDIQLAALLASWFAGALAVVLFYELAREYVESPLFAAFLFSFLPYTWLLGGSVAMVESTYLCALIGCVLAVHHGRVGWAAALAAVTVLSQKSGFLLLPALVLGARPRARALWPVLAAVAAAAILQGYLWWRFGDPFVNARAARDVFGNEGGWFAIPFAAFVKWMLEPGSLFADLYWPRKAIIVLEAACYVGLLVWAIRRWSPRLTLLVCWLGTVVLFHSLLKGIFAFYAFPRFMVMAAPAALLLACHYAPRVGQWKWWIAAGLLLPATVAWTVVDSLDAFDLCVRHWTPDYYRLLIRALAVTD